MDITRRTALGTAALLAAAPASAQTGVTIGPRATFGIIGKITAKEGMRDGLAAAMLEGSAAMPGCLGYVVAEDKADPNTLWVTEVWDSEVSHGASLQLAEVQDAIAKAKPMIAGFDTVATTRPIGGVGVKWG